MNRLAVYLAIQKKPKGIREVELEELDRLIVLVVVASEPRVVGRDRGRTGKSWFF